MAPARTPLGNCFRNDITLDIGQNNADIRTAFKIQGYFFFPKRVCQFIVKISTLTSVTFFLLVGTQFRPTDQQNGWRLRTREFGQPWLPATSRWAWENSNWTTAPKPGLANKSWIVQSHFRVMVFLDYCCLSTRSPSILLNIKWTPRTLPYSTRYNV